jgi:hypothetical protein
MPGTQPTAVPSTHSTTQSSTHTAAAPPGQTVPFATGECQPLFHHRHSHSASISRNRV